MSTMKILLLYRDSCDREITSSVVSGGGEQFCKLIDKNFDVPLLKTVRGSGYILHDPDEEKTEVK